MDNLKSISISTSPKEISKAEEMRQEMKKYYESFFDENVYNMILNLIRIRASHGNVWIRIELTSGVHKYYNCLIEKLQKDGFSTRIYSIPYFNKENSIEPRFFLEISWEK